MSASKLVFNLVYLGPSSSAHAIYFRVLSTDTRFRECGWRSSNGWLIRSAAYPAVDFSTRIVHLSGIGTARAQTEAIITYISAETEGAAVVRIQALLDALKEWALLCPQVNPPMPTGSDIVSPEVRESLSYAELEAEDAEPADGEAPLYVDVFDAPNIAV